MCLVAQSARWCKSTQRKGSPPSLEGSDEATGEAILPHPTQQEAVSGRGLGITLKKINKRGKRLFFECDDYFSVPSFLCSRGYKLVKRQICKFDLT
jgi:hypothetical protein